MFCFQCEQTVGCAGCTGNAGVCGKKADTARLQDELTGALVGLARAVDSTTAISKRTGQIIIEGLFTTVTNVNFDDVSIENMIQKSELKKKDWFLTAANVNHLAVKQTNTICNSCGMPTKIYAL